LATMRDLFGGQNVGNMQQHCSWLLRLLIQSRSDD
jgi:hypothetical protein